MMESKGEHIYLSSETRTTLYDLADRLGLSKAAVVREAVKLLEQKIKEGRGEK